MRRKFTFYSLCIASMMLCACSDESTETSDQNKCSNQEDCAANPDGNTKCNTETGKCERPDVAKECNNDSNCAGRSDGKTRCNTATGVCELPAASKECSNDSNCAGRSDGKTKCNTATGVCELPTASKECTNDSSCAGRSDGKTKCNTTTWVCELPASSKECTNDSSCAGRSDGKTRCNTATGVCELPASSKECTNDSSCAGRSDGKTKCNTTTGVCELSASSKECTNDSNCAGRSDGKTRCNTATGVCEFPVLSKECISDSNCVGRSDGKTKCDIWSSFKCIECVGDSDCANRSDNKTKCNDGSHTCYSPDAAPSCGDGVVNQSFEACDNSDLADRTCADVSVYKAGILGCTPSCMFDTSKCVECTDDIFCLDRTDGLTSCDLSTNTCVEPPSTYSNLKWYEEYNCGIDTFQAGNDNYNHNYTTTTNTPNTVYGLIWVKNCTEGTGWCSKIVGAHLLYTESSNASSPLNTWKRVDAQQNFAFNADGPNANNDEYMATLSFENTGEYRYVFSYDLKEHPYNEKEIAQTIYCYVEWPENGTVDQMGKATITENKAEAYCGNGVIDQPTEMCDGPDLGGKQCSDLNPRFLTNGNALMALHELKCNDQCQFDTSMCFECTEYNLNNCESDEYCRTSRSPYRCTKPFCGDGHVDEGEVCDPMTGTGIHEWVLRKDGQGMTQYEMPCKSDCSGIDYSLAMTCNDRFPVCPKHVENLKGCDISIGYCVPNSP